MRDSARRYRGWQSFVDAGRGFVTVFRTEWNFRIHLGISALVTLSGFVFRIGAGEWIALLLSAGLVLVSEIFNTVIEYLSDTLHPEMDRGIGMAKDAAAGAVLVAAVTSALIGGVIFLPKLWNWLMTIIQ